MGTPDPSTQVDPQDEPDELDPRFDDVLAVATPSLPDANDQAVHAPTVEGGEAK